MSVNSKELDRKDIHVFNFDQLKPSLHLKNDMVYLVNFWGIWCAPCLPELPAIKAVEEKYSDQKFKVLLVSFDKPSQLKTRLIPYVRSYQIPYSVNLCYFSFIKSVFMRKV